jgi:hypothetical protein
MRVGLITDLTMVNSCYRGLPVLQLAKRGHEVVLGSDGKRHRSELLGDCDVVHIYRYQDNPTRRLVEQLRGAGVGVVWDNDDDLAGGIVGISESTARGALRSQQAQSDTIRMLRLAHVVTTPSTELAEEYRASGAACVRVVENFLPADYAPGDPQPHDGVTIGWTACEEHKHDLAKLDVRGTLRGLLDAHPRLRVASIGLDLGLPERYTRYPLVQYGQLAEHVARFDIGIAPLDDIPFNRARSNVKLKEYAASSVAWLASPVGPYLGLGERQGGRLVADDAWPDQLDRLIRDERARRKLAKRGRKWAAGETVARNVQVWEAALAEAAERARTA